MGDSVRVSDNQRLDKPDFDALQSLVYRGMREAIGGMLGGSAGALTPVVWSKSNANGVYLLSFEKMVVAWSKAVEARVEDRGADPAVTVNVGYESRIIPFDPDETGHQNHPLDYTEARTAEQGTPGTKPYIWVRPVIVPADTDVRRFWSTAIGDETAAATETRNFVRLEFAINETTPAQGLGDKWSAIARVMTWSGNDIARINAISVWDDPDIAGMLQDPGDPEEYTGDNASMAHPLQRMREGSAPRVLSVQNDGSEDDWPQGVRRAFGLPQALQWVYSRIQRHISGGINDPVGTDIASWWELPQISLNGAYERLETTDAAVAANAVDIATNASGNVAQASLIAQNSQRFEVLCSGLLQFRPAGAFGSPDASAGWALAHSWGIEAVTMGANERNVSIEFKPSLVTGRTGWFVVGATCTPVHAPGLVSDPSAFVLAPIMVPDPFAAPATLGATPAGELSQYLGAAVGLGAGEYGLGLRVTQLTDDGAGAGIQGIAPADGAMTDVMVWSVTVFISKYTGNEAGI